jgi:hypothetical protein
MLTISTAELSVLPTEPKPATSRPLDQVAARCMCTLPIVDYVLISDCRSSALFSRRASMDW